MRVLIADDQPDSAESLAELLRAWAYTPVLAYDGCTALELLRAPDAPTLAILDWVMPGLSGIEVCRELRRRDGSPYTYAILVTGRGDRAEMLHGLQAGADDYLIKPVDPFELQARLSTARRILDLQAQLLATQWQLREQATRDALTGLWNRAMILEALDRELPRSRREGHPVSVILADIDHFKRINDTHGHLAGDRVLRQTAKRMQAVLRPYDTVGRYGGEEFLVVLPGCGREQALALAERLRQAIEAAPVMEGGAELAVTLSLGMATWDGQLAPQELLRVADAALYEAKRSGRNRVVSADLPSGC